jgi:hypothetical protein
MVSTSDSIFFVVGREGVVLFYNSLFFENRDNRYKIKLKFASNIILLEYLVL